MTIEKKHSPKTKLGLGQVLGVCGGHYRFRPLSNEAWFVNACDLGISLHVVHSSSRAQKRLLDGFLRNQDRP
jgi:hypothetical protein